jgi:hypothetical protein
MSNAVTLIIVSIVILLAGALGWFIAHLRTQKRDGTHHAGTERAENWPDSNRPLSPSPTAHCRKTTPRSCNWRRNP